MTEDVEPTREPILGPSDIEPILGPLPPIEPIFAKPSSPVSTAEPQPKVDPETEVDSEPAQPAEMPDVVRRLLDAGRFVLALAVFLVPVIFDPRTVDAFNLSKLTALWVLTLVAGGLWAASALAHGRRFRPAVPKSWIVRLSLVVLGITAVATAFSSSPALSFFGLYHRFEGLISVVLYVTLLLLIYALSARRPDAVRQLAAAVGTAALIVAGYVLLQEYGIDFERWQQVSGGRPELPIGNLGNSVLTGSFLGISVPFVVALVITAAGWARRAGWLIGAVFVAAGLWFTQSRSGFIAAGAGLIAMILFAWVPLNPWRKLAVVAAALLVLGVAPLAAPGVVGPRSPAGLGITSTRTAGQPVPVWDAAWRMAIERPVLGWGPETFYGNFARFRSLTEATEQRLVIVDKPQNIFLGWATSTGFVGLLAFLALIGAGIVLAGRARQSRHRVLAVAFGGGLVAYLAQGMYSIDVPPLAMMGWVCLAGLAALHSRDVDVAAPTGSTRAGWLGYVAVGTAFIALVTIGIRPLRADHAAWTAEQRSSAGWSGQTMQLYEKAVALHPFEAGYKGLAAFYLERVAGNQAAPFRLEEALLRAVSYYEQSHDLQPDNVYFMINAARVYERLGAGVDVKYYAQSDRWLGRAIVVDPLDPQLHDLYAAMLGGWASKVENAVMQQEIERRSAAQTALSQQLRAGRPIG